KELKYLLTHYTHLNPNNVNKNYFIEKSKHLKNATVLLVAILLLTDCIGKKLKNATVLLE
ncbi:hypothetical protein ACT3TI_14285, partial [Psychrobacter sp. AOP22-C1-22]|uniref:hypothetical protein n=1 Tax=unclassified Psychrobacter TaxID=196806 RepID=UPI004037B4F2